MIDPHQVTLEPKAGVTGVTLGFRDVPSGVVVTLHIPSGLPDH